MRVLVTGGCGFLGSHVCELFNRKGWDVIAYDNMSKFELMRTGYNVEDARDYNYNLLVQQGISVIVADIRDYDKLQQHIKGCDYVIHTAAQPAMTIAYEDPRFDFDNNALGTLNVLDASLRHGAACAVCSTIHVYGNGINDQTECDEERFYHEPINESHKILTGSISPLHASKRAAEIYVRAYGDSFSTQMCVFRLTGIYGPRQLGGEDHGWVANFAIRTVLGLPIKVFGTDKQVRDILYVTDAAQAFFDWFNSHRNAQEYNIGGGENCITSIRSCLNTLSEITHKKQDITVEPPRKGDLWYFCCDITKANTEFRWRPKVLPQQGIFNLVEWIEQERRLFR